MKSTYQILRDGIRASRLAGDQAEVGKRGTLRGGNTGVILEDGTHLGKCARLSWLRMQGINAEQEDHSRELMFDAGHTNEDSWHDLLVQGGVAPELIRREEQVPIAWNLPSGRLVTGRPDLVIGAVGADGGWTPQRGLEFKLVSSLWTARDIAIGKYPTKSRPEFVEPSPKALHLMQAAHYAWKLGCKFELWYTSRVDFACANAAWPKPGQAGSEFIDYDDSGRAMKVRPFVLGYEIEWRGDTLLYRRADPLLGPWRETPITKTGITRYYETVDNISTTKVLPPRPLNVMADGSPGSYSACTYCPLKQVCDKRESEGLDKWAAAVVEWVPKLPSTGTMRD